LRLEFEDRVEHYAVMIDELAMDGLLQKSQGHVCLTPRGRLLSNEVFERFIADRSAA